MQPKKQTNPMHCAQMEALRFTETPNTRTPTLAIRDPNKKQTRDQAKATDPITEYRRYAYRGPNKRQAKKQQKAANPNISMPTLCNPSTKQTADRKAEKRRKPKQPNANCTKPKNQTEGKQKAGKKAEENLSYSTHFTVTPKSSTWGPSSPNSRCGLGGPWVAPPPRRATQGSHPSYRRGECIPPPQGRRQAVKNEAGGEDDDQQEPEAGSGFEGGVLGRARKVRSYGHLNRRRWYPHQQ